MPLEPLENLVRIGQLKVEPPAQAEIAGLIRSAEIRLKDAQNESLAVESRFDLAYHAAHSLSLAALRWHGYRSENRQAVFQTLAHTVQLPPEQWRVLAEAHRRRNLIEYEGIVETEPQLVAAILRVTLEIENRVKALPPC